MTLTCKAPRLVDIVRKEMQEEFITARDRQQLRAELHELVRHALQWIEDIDGSRNIPLDNPTASE